MGIERTEAIQRCSGALITKGNEGTKVKGPGPRGSLLLFLLGLVEDEIFFFHIVEF